MENKNVKKYIVGIDTGGTFTDITVVDNEGNVTSAKSPSTPKNFSEGIINGLREAAKPLNITEEELISNCEIINHGMTVATNALINRKGAKTGLITTKGFEDIIFIMKARGKCLGLPEIEIKHQTRCQKPEPIVPKQYVKGVTERIDCFGNVVFSLNIEEVKAAAKSLVEDCGMESLAVCLLWSLTNPSHEKEIQRIIAEIYPHIEVSISSDIAPLVGEYERTVTTVFNAYLKPETKSYLKSLEDYFLKKKLRTSILIMQSHGGISTIRKAMDAPVFTIGSGPTGGVISSLIWGKELGYTNIVTTDVGGTSFDVSLIVNNDPMRTEEAILNQYRLRLQMVNVISIGAGGGSVGWIDPAMNTLKVGPRSMGADPGPACYDRGGGEATLVDSDVVLGYLNPEYFLGGRMKLNKDNSMRAIKKLADQLGMDVVETARGMRKIACSNMADLIQNQIMFKGYDPQNFVIFLYGGGGPEFGAEYSKFSGVKEAIMLYKASTFSAFGIGGSDVIYTKATTELHHMPTKPEKVNHVFSRLEESILNELKGDGFNVEDVLIVREASLRYGRQVNYVNIPVKGGELNSKDMDQLTIDFENRYEAIYGKGSGHRSSGIELVNFRVYASIKTPKPVLMKYKRSNTIPKEAFSGKREVFFEDRFIETRIYRWEKLRPGNQIEGPAMIEAEFTTGAMPQNMTATVDNYLNIHLRLS